MTLSSRSYGIRLWIFKGGIGLALVAASVVLAQLPTATILGVVRDSSGAVVPGVNITARNVETGQTRAGVSGENGSYRFAALPVGAYEVRSEHPGFQSEIRSGLTLAVGDEAVVNFTLQLGAVEQTVSVTAEAPLVNTTSGTVGTLVSEQKVADLPLNGRNYMALTLMQPGINLHTNKNSTGLASVGSWYSSNGASLRSNNFLLDGAIITNANAGTSASQDGNTLGVEGIREFRVITNAFSAEYGITSGSQVMVVTKGGTNQLHGSLFEYLRNSALDARNFFDYPSEASQRRLPAFTRNQFGGSAGGPIKKDSTFVFGVFETLHERLGLTVIDDVIPTSAKVDGGAGGVAQIAPAIKPILALFPDPNLPNNQFTYPAKQPLTDNYGQLRVDQTFSTNDTMFARYTVSDTQQTDPLDYPQFHNERSSRNQFATLSETHVFSPALLNTARFSFSRTYPHIDSPSGIIGPEYSFVTGRELGVVQVAGLTTLGPSSTTPSTQKQNIFTYSDDVFFSGDKHSLKFGFLLNHYQQYLLTQTNNRGTINFNSLTNFLNGTLNTITALTPGSVPDRTWQYNTIGFYAQDDFHVLPNLTLNLGLRYEIQTVPRDSHGIESALRDVQHDAEGTIGPPFENPSLLNFSPRFGFAWDIKGDGVTAIRGGFSELFDVGLYAQALAIATTGTPPFASNSTVRGGTLALPLAFPASAAGKSLRTQDYHMQQPHLLSYNLAVERQLPGRTVLTLTYAGSRGLNIVSTTDGNPTIPQGVGVNGVCVAASASEVADIHRPNRCWMGGDPRTNPNWSNMEFKTAGSSSWYNALQFSFAKQLSHGLQFQSAYTWSKLIDFSQGEATGDSTATSLFNSDPTHREVDRAVADFDLTQTWRLNAIYELPQLVQGKLLNTVLGGWKASGLLSVSDGLPFTVAVNSNRSRSGVNGGTGGIDRPNVVTGRTKSDLILGGPNQYFDPSGFALQPTGFLGDAGRNLLRGPGLATLDFSLIKEVPVSRLGDSGSLQFRAEFFNLLNRANFAAPTRTVFSGTGTSAAVPLSNAGRITSTITPSRQVQLALRLQF